MDVTVMKLLKGDRIQLLKHKIKKSKQVVDVLERKNLNQLSINKTIQATIISPLMHTKHASLQFL